MQDSFEVVRALEVPGDSSPKELLEHFVVRYFARVLFVVVLELDSLHGFELALAHLVQHLSQARAVVFFGPVHVHQVLDDLRNVSVLVHLLLHFVREFLSYPTFLELGQSYWVVCLGDVLDHLPSVVDLDFERHVQLLHILDERGGLAVGPQTSKHRLTRYLRRHVVNTSKVLRKLLRQKFHFLVPVSQRLGNLPLPPLKQSLNLDPGLHFLFKFLD